MTAPTTTAESTTMQLVPYVFFYGKCEEALEFYKSVLGGSYQALRQGQAPASPDHPVDPKHAQKIMNASFTAPGFSFMCSDGRPDESKTIDPDEGNISLALHVPDKSRADEIFAGLARGGKIAMPLQDAFWGGRFGSIHDKFGIEWMVTAP